MGGEPMEAADNVIPFPREKMIPNWGVKVPRSSGRPTGSPDWFKKAKAEATHRKVLQSYRTAKYLDQIAVKAPAIPVEYGNLWALINAEKADLLKLPGVGPATLKKLHAHLVGSGLSVKWQVEASK